MLRKRFRPVVNPERVKLLPTAAVAEAEPHVRQLVRCAGPFHSVVCGADRQRRPQPGNIQTLAPPLITGVTRKLFHGQMY